jgi:hypothetical protein
MKIEHAFCHLAFATVLAGSLSWASAVNADVLRNILTLVPTSSFAEVTADVSSTVDGAPPQSSAPATDLIPTSRS